MEMFNAVLLSYLNPLLYGSGIFVTAKTRLGLNTLCALPGKDNTDCRVTQDSTALNPGTAQEALASLPMPFSHIFADYTPGIRVLLRTVLCPA